MPAKGEVEMTKEEKARHCVSTPALFRKRMNGAIAALTREAKQYYRQRNYDFARRRVISDDGVTVLQWLLRCYPLKPVSYENQQTNIGSVVFMSLDVSDSYHLVGPETIFGVETGVDTQE